METRIEIYKDDQWRALRLADNISIKYNAVINKVGNVATREISHTNTFSLPQVFQNTQTLGLNVFNPSALAKAMNAKYVAKYYVQDKLLQSGFIVVNNIKDGIINVNFIEESLSLTSIWGSTTFQELLQDEVLEFPADYATAISELRNYDLTKTALLTKLPEVGTRGYTLCSFPNSLNTIGDKFQLDDNGIRQDNVFNPYQSRPIFNVKSLFDLSTESFGYTPIYDDSVDWEQLEKTYIVPSGSDESKEGLNGVQTIQHDYFGYCPPYQIRSFFGTYNTKALFQYNSSNALRPNDIPNWKDPADLVFETAFGTTTDQPWLSQYTVFTPEVSGGNSGIMRFIGNWPGGVGTDESIVWTIWKNATPGGDVISSAQFVGGVYGYGTNYVLGTTYQIDLSVNKVILDTPPAGAGEFIGIMFAHGKNGLSSPDGVLRDVSVNETYLPEGTVAFDEYGQYIPTIDVDLSHNAPQKSIKELLSAAMHKEGILMDINASAKTVKFFNYGAYEQQRVDGYFSDWSKYLLRYSGFAHNTNYGTKYAKKNRIGLSSPYQGNHFDITLTNQGEDSKYKDFAIDSTTTYSDVINVAQIDNTTTPYFEYAHEGLGLVEIDTTLGTLEQEQANGTSHGNFTGLDLVANVNYAQIPDGVKWWYKMVDNAIRVTAQFLLPVDVVRGLDMSEPIYVEELGGFYIIEEIKEYVDGATPVKVKLIKLIDNFRNLVQPGPASEATISLSVDSLAPNAPITFVYSMAINMGWLNYTPTSSGSTIIIQKLTGSGGSNSGAPEVINVTPVSPYTAQQYNKVASFPITAAEEGYYNITIQDSVEGISSETVEGVLGDP